MAETVLGGWKYSVTYSGTALAAQNVSIRKISNAIVEESFRGGATPFPMAGWDAASYYEVTTTVYCQGGINIISGMTGTGSVVISGDSLNFKLSTGVITNCTVNGAVNSYITATITFIGLSGSDGSSGTPTPKPIAFNSLTFTPTDIDIVNFSATISANTRPEFVNQDTQPSYIVIGTATASLSLEAMGVVDSLTTFKISGTDFEIDFPNLAVSDITQDISSPSDYVRTRITAQAYEGESQQIKFTI